MSKEIKKRTKVGMVAENSFGIMRKENKVEMEFIVRLPSDDNYGSFEFYDTETGGDQWYAEGGLWFDEDKNLTDYDGVFALSYLLIEMLEQNGYNADYAK